MRIVSSVACLIEFDAERIEAAADLGAGGAVVLTDAAGEDEHVESAELCDVGTDESADGGGEEIDGQSCGCASGGDGVAQGAHITGNSADAEEAGLAIDDLFESIGGIGGARMGVGKLAQKKQQDTGIDVAGACGGDEAACGCEAHGGIDGAPVVDGEVQELFAAQSANRLQPALFGTPAQRKRFLRERYNRMPLFVRPFLFFGYRYLLRLGFLDGKEGFIYWTLQTFWFRFLIDAKIWERRNLDRIRRPIDAALITGEKSRP